MIAAILVELIVAGFVGWLTGKIMKYNTNVICNILMGLIGGVVGSIVLGCIGLQASGFIGGLVVSIVGACLIVILYRAIK